MATNGSPGKGKSTERPPTEWPETREEFVKWFWSGNNGNDLIGELNCKPGTDCIRREKERPTIYGIVLNHDLFPGKEGDVQWKLCKVGFTHVSTDTGSNNRMEQLKEKIKKTYKGAGVLFVLPIGAVDTTKFSETEKRIRNKVGWPVHKDVAKKLKLPCSTEWVLTTQTHIDLIKEKKEDLKAEGIADLIDLFKGLKFKTDHPSCNWVKLEDVDSTPTVTVLPDLQEWQ